MRLLIQHRGMTVLVPYSSPQYNNSTKSKQSKYIAVLAHWGLTDGSDWRTTSLGSSYDKSFSPSLPCSPWRWAQAIRLESLISWRGRDSSHGELLRSARPRLATGANWRGIAQVGKWPYKPETVCTHRGFNSLPLRLAIVVQPGHSPKG